MISVSNHIKSILDRLPETPGVYQYLDENNTIIYIGKAVNLKRRVSSYFQKDHEWTKTRQLVAHIRDIKYVVVETEQDALLLENNLIKQYQPHYNILLKDGKSYPSICITKEPFPRIFKTRKIIKGEGEYFGPYSYGHIVDYVLETIHKLYPIRTCHTVLTEKGVNNNRYKVCLKYHLKNCCGICEGKVCKSEYDEYILSAKKIIRGDGRIIAKELEEQMNSYAQKMAYELAKEKKEKLELIEKFCSKTIITNTNAGELDVFGYEEQDQNVYISILHLNKGSITQGQTITYKKQLDEQKEEVLAMGMIELRERLGSHTADVIVPFIPDGFDENLHIHIAVSGDKKKLLDLAQQNVHQYKEDMLRQADKLNPDQRSARLLKRLQELLEMQELPVFIDSFDNSNIQGTDAVASCIVFKKGRPSKNDYKRFQIKSVIGPDDYASMREVVRRRYQDILDENGDLPNLIIADGGLGQMHAIREVVENQLGLHIPIAGLKKDDRHRTNTLLYGFPPKEISLAVTDELFRLLVEIQDEVHRFAISYHKNKRSKSQTRSELDDIKGVGEVSKQKILQSFHSMTRVKNATLDELVEKLGNHLGLVVYKHFKGKISA